MSRSTIIGSVRQCSIAAALAQFGLFGMAAPAHAQPQPTLPPVNLGNSSFMDGQSAPGLQAQEILTYFEADSFRDSNGQALSAPHAITAEASQTQLVYFSQHRLLGAYVGADVQLPIIRLDLEPALGMHIKQTGLGDLIVSPLILQWRGQHLLGRPYSHRLSLTAMLPTGGYRDDRLINTGDNIFRFNPYYAATWEFAPRWEASMRLHYLWVSKNHDPPVALAAQNSQAGQALHLNFATSYAFSPKFRLGLAGYALKQIGDDRVDGARAHGSRERIFGLGPGLMWKAPAATLIANLYIETGARNRPEGTRLAIRLAKHL